MDLDNIRLLLHVVELGSVHRAARQLGISRTTMRRRLEALEGEIGCELFVANTSGATLTTAGAVVAEEGRRLLERSAHMLSSARAVVPGADGVLRIILPLGAPDQIRLQLLQATRMKAPLVSVHEREVADPLALLHEPFEIMFHFGLPPAHGEWFSRALHVFRIEALASRAYLDAHGCPTSLKDLERHTLLAWGRPGADPVTWPLTSGGTVNVAPALVSNNARILYQAAQAGMGILLSSSEQTFIPDGPPLTRVLPDLIGGSEVLRVLSTLPANVDIRVRAVVEDVQALFGALGSET